MKIKAWFIIAVIFAITTGTAYSAEIQVGYTNQFFVSKIGEGYCYVFLYPGNGKITFVKYNEKKGSSEKIDINVSVNNISNIFVIKNELFIMLADNVFNIYDISELIKGENNNTRLAIKGRIGQLRCDSFALYEDRLFFTKDKEPQMYEYTGKMNNTPINNVNIDSAADYSFFQYNPISEFRERRYKELVADLGKEVDALTNKKNTISLSPKKMPPRGAKIPVLGDIYHIMEADIAKIANLDIRKYADIFILASLTGKNHSEITTKIERLHTKQTSIDREITTYYAQAAKIDDLETRDTIAERKKIIAGSIQSLKENMFGKYPGITIEEMETKYNYYDGIINSSKYTWEQEPSTKKDFNAEYDNNKTIIETYHNELMKLSNNKISDQVYLAWIQFYNNLQEFMRDKGSLINSVDDSNGIKEVACNNGRLINSKQHTIAKQYIKEKLLNNHTLDQFRNDITDYTTKRNKEEAKLGSVKSEWDRELSSAQTARDTAFKTITGYCIDWYFNEKYITLSNLKSQNNYSLPQDYDNQYKDYIKMSGMGNTIYGFKNSQTINYREVRLLENNDGKPVRYIRPDSNNLVRFIDDTSVLLLKDLNEIVKYDLTVLNKITASPIKLSKEIFYVLSSGKSYYYVTKDGELYEINSSKPVSDAKLSAGDTVLITTRSGTDYIYILKEDGQIISSQGSKAELFIKPVNSGNIQTIQIRDKKFIFQG